MTDGIHHDHQRPDGIHDDHQHPRGIMTDQELNHEEARAITAAVKRRRERALAAATMVAGVLGIMLFVLAYTTVQRGHRLKASEPAAAAGRRLCASVRNGMRMDRLDLEQTTNLGTRDRAVESLLGDRVPDAADVVELCTPLPGGARVSDCRARHDYACLAAIAGELERAPMVDVAP